MKEEEDEGCRGSGRRHGGCPELGQAAPHSPGGSAPGGRSLRAFSCLPAPAVAQRHAASVGPGAL